MRIDVFGSKIKPNDKELIEKILTFIEIKDYELIDVMTIENPKAKNPCIVFGHTSLTLLDLNSNIMWLMPDVKKLDKIKGQEEARKLSLATAIEIKKWITNNKNINTSSNIKTNSYVEKNNIKIGIGIGDIQLTEKELKTLKHIKELVNANKIIITKGNIKLEVE